jgi:RHS repeat-associated protein
MLAPNLPRPSTTNPQGVRVPLVEDTPDLGIEWDAENRLQAVKQGGNTLASFTYDGSGRRSTKTASGITTTFVYDGVQFLEERPGVGGMNRYVYGPGIDRALASSAAGVSSYFVADHLGSVVRATDASGATTLTREYDPWGNPLQGSATSGYSFTGREWDAQTGLYYYRARYYDPILGRFVAEDPAGLAGSDHGSLYAYASNAPVRLIDPAGLRPGERFKTRDKAVLDAYRWMKETGYEAGKWEFGGLVCEDKDKCFTCTGPVTDSSERTVDVDKAPCPSGAKARGYYHTHPLYSTGFSGDDWAKADRNPSKPYAAYVWLTGNGYVVRYEDGVQTTIDTIKFGR